MLEITKENFESEVIKSDLPVLVDFWATWCGPCRMIVPAVESVSTEYADKIKVGKGSYSSSGDTMLRVYATTKNTSFYYTCAVITE